MLINKLLSPRDNLITGDKDGLGQEGTFHSVFSGTLPDESNPINHMKPNEAMFSYERNQSQKSVRFTQVP